MQVHCVNTWAYLKTLPQISRHLVAVFQNYARMLRLALTWREYLKHLRSRRCSNAAGKIALRCFVSRHCTKTRVNDNNKHKVRGKSCFTSVYAARSFEQERNAHAKRAYTHETLENALLRKGKCSWNVVCTAIYPCCAAIFILPGPQVSSTDEHFSLGLILWTLPANIIVQGILFCLLKNAAVRSKKKKKEDDCRRIWQGQTVLLRKARNWGYAIHKPWKH